MMDFSRHVSSAALPASRRIADALTLEEHVRKAFEQLLEAYGFLHFMVMTVPPAASRTLMDAILMTSVPPDVFQSYDAAGMISTSPVIGRLQRSTIPFIYDLRLDPRRGTGGAVSEVLALFERVNFQNGAFIPVHDAQGVRGAVCFSGDRTPVTTGELKELTFLAAYLFSRLSEIRTRARRTGALSRREIECLHWAAAGKTTAEIAKILLLSDYTVNHYLSRATRKLDSVNRVQTVAKAIRAGLID